MGAGQVAALALLFDDQGAGPEQVDEAVGARGVERADALFVDGDLFAGDAEDPEELVVEGLGLALLVALALPVLSEAGGVGADFGPAQAHGGVSMRPVVAGAAQLDKAADAPLWGRWRVTR